MTQDIQVRADIATTPRQMRAATSAPMTQPNDDLAISAAVLASLSTMPGPDEMPSVTTGSETAPAINTFVSFAPATPAVNTVPMATAQTDGSISGQKRQEATHATATTAATAATHKRRRRLKNELTTTFSATQVKNIKDEVKSAAHKGTDFPYKRFLAIKLFKGFTYEKMEPLVKKMIAEERESSEDMRKLQERLQAQESRQHDVQSQLNDERAKAAQLEAKVSTSVDVSEKIKLQADLDEVKNLWSADRAKIRQLEKRLQEQESRQHDVESQLNAERTKVSQLEASVSAATEVTKLQAELDEAKKQSSADKAKIAAQDKRIDRLGTALLKQREELVQQRDAAIAELHHSRQQHAEDTQMYKKRVMLNQVEIDGLKKLVADLQKYGKEQNTVIAELQAELTRVKDLLEVALLAVTAGPRFETRLRKHVKEILPRQGVVNPDVTQMTMSALRITFCERYELACVGSISRAPVYHDAKDILSRFWDMRCDLVHHEDGWRNLNVPAFSKLFNDSKKLFEDMDAILRGDRDIRFSVGPRANFEKAFNK
jgi:chromosome segregation ATPase